MDQQIPVVTEPKIRFRFAKICFDRDSSGLCTGRNPYFNYLVSNRDKRTDRSTFKCNSEWLIEIISSYRCCLSFLYIFTYHTTYNRLTDLDFKIIIQHKPILENDL